MIFTDKTILSFIESGDVVIKPFARENLGTNSVDLTLCPEILTYRQGDNYSSEIMRGKGYSENVDINGKTIFIPKAYDFFVDPKTKNETYTWIIPEEGMILIPGMLYIACTNEYTETHNAVPKLEGKSSLGRLGLFIHVTAGYGDVGFCGKWTLELVATVPIKIYPNMKICQISYHGISEPPLVKYSDKKDQKYNGQDKPVASLYHQNFENK